MGFSTEQDKYNIRDGRKGVFINDSRPLCFPYLFERSPSPWLQLSSSRDDIVVHRPYLGRIEVRNGLLNHFGIIRQNGFKDQ